MRRGCAICHCVAQDLGGCDLTFGVVGDKDEPQEGFMPRFKGFRLDRLTEFREFRRYGKIRQGHSEGLASVEHSLLMASFHL